MSTFFPSCKYVWKYNYQQRIFKKWKKWIIFSKKPQPAPEPSNALQYERNKISVVGHSLSYIHVVFQEPYSGPDAPSLRPMWRRSQMQTLHIRIQEEAGWQEQLLHKTKRELARNLVQMWVLWLKKHLSGHYRCWPHTRYGISVFFFSQQKLFTLTGDRPVSSTCLLVCTAFLKNKMGF